MTYDGKKWICYVVALLWLIVAVMRILENASISVIVLSFAAVVIFLGLGMYYTHKAKQ